MKIKERFGRGHPLFSFEFFPPKDDRGVDALFETVANLRPLGPAFVSVTYGAGGSTREKTVAITQRIKREAGIEAMAHLTCVGHGRDEIGRLLDEYEDAGIENVMALRGDPPRGDDTFVPHPQGFSHADQLIAFIRQRKDFCIGGAGYPEVHPEAPGPRKTCETSSGRSRPAATSSSPSSSSTSATTSISCRARGRNTSMRPLSRA